MEKRICYELDKQGFRHDKKDGTLYVVNHESVFHIHIWDTSNKRVKRLYFVYDFEDERHKNISKEGWMMARPWMNSTDFIHTWKGIIQTNQQTIKVALDLNNR